MLAPVFVLGNPLWVTNAALGAVGGANLPAAQTVHVGLGIEAVTGGANFDISEWMIRETSAGLRTAPARSPCCARQAWRERHWRTLWSLNAPVKAAAIYSIATARSTLRSMQSRRIPASASEEECDTLHEMVSSPAATELWSSMIFWDSKRPILTRLVECLG